MRVKATGSDFASDAGIVIIGAGAAKTYTLNITSTHTLADAAYGYEQPAAQAITIQSSGNWDSTITSVTVDSTAFTIGGSGGTVAAGGFISSWTVQPKAGLAAGTHTATITVTYNNRATATATVCFNVSPRDITVTITPGGGCYGNITPATAELNGQVDGENPAVTLTYTGTANDGTDYNSTTVPTEAGNYTVTASISDTNYNLTGTVTEAFAVAKAAQDAPEAPTVKSKTYNSVTLETIPDNTNGAAAQYSMDGGNTWQDSPTFTGLRSTTQYSFVAQYGATDNYFASPVSEPVAVTTNNVPVSTYPPVMEQPDEGGTVTISPKNPSAGAKVTITATPEEGYEVNEIIVTDKNGDPVEVTNNGDGTYSFTQPAGKVDIKVTFMEDNTMLNLFVDVPAHTYYYDAVLWAAKKGITGGVDDTRFAPNATCTRAQVVTFLWRAAGSPEPESLSSLSDVPADAYYAKAVAWALENGITTGTGNGTFTPNAVCSRGQIVTFLWRALGETSGAAAPFADVAADAYYALAVAWAVANGITNGTSDTTFSPSANCTRAQIVTFLYRCLGDE